MCCDPFGDHEREDVVVPTEQVHHIEPVGDNPDRALDESNCAALCASCHDRVSKMECRGEDAKGVFDVGCA